MTNGLELVGGLGTGLIGGFTSGLLGVSPGGGLVVFAVLLLGAEQHVA
ncbi:MAG: sulfite exporter TauE/SafE family protein, partial [Bradyrhizobium sp.]|nr:sulfite exporter TauE/SafE family protein [Bradyrhizobium sp.]